MTRFEAAKARRVAATKQRNRPDYDAIACNAMCVVLGITLLLAAVAWSLPAYH